MSRPTDRPTDRPIERSIADAVVNKRPKRAKKKVTPVLIGFVVLLSRQCRWPSRVFCVNNCGQRSSLTRLGHEALSAWRTVCSICQVREHKTALGPVAAGRTICLHTHARELPSHDKISPCDLLSTRSLSLVDRFQAGGRSSRTSKGRGRLPAGNFFHPAARQEPQLPGDETRCRCAWSSQGLAAPPIVQRRCSWEGAGHGGRQRRAASRSPGYQSPNCGGRAQCKGRSSFLSLWVRPKHVPGVGDIPL